MTNYVLTYWPTIFTIVILFIFVIVLFQILNFDLNSREIFIEGFGPSSSIDFIDKVNDSDPVKLNEICKSFSNDTCKISDFCVLVNGDKCLGGSLSGPTFLTEQGKDLDVNYYIHKEKCHGECKE